MIYFHLSSARQQYIDLFFASWQLGGSEMPNIVRTQDAAAQQACQSKTVMQYPTIRSVLQSLGAKLLVLLITIWNTVILVAPVVWNRDTLCIQKIISKRN